MFEEQEEQEEQDELNPAGSYYEEGFTNDQLYINHND